jgi:hypothetical protein
VTEAMELFGVSFRCIIDAASGTVNNLKEITMKRILIPVICIFALQLTAQSQTFLKMAAKESLPDVLAKAKTDLAPDAQLRSVTFVESDVQTFTMKMDLASGKADDWFYMLYSPSLDSSMGYVVFNVPLLGKTLQAVPGQKGSATGDAELSEPFLDSPAALQALKNGSAGTFFQAHADASVTFAFAANSGTPIPQLPVGKFWVFYLHSAADSVICYLDGVSGTSYNCTSFTAVAGIPEAKGYRLDQNFPNPVSLHANTGTTIRYAVAERQPVRLAVYDLLGRELAVLQNGFVNEGEYSMTLPASSISRSGFYFYRLETARGSMTKRFIVSE